VAASSLVENICDEMIDTYIETIMGRDLASCKRMTGGGVDPCSRR
jgi:hypothetical protein